MANSITFNHEFIKELYSILDSKKISEITFVLSVDNKIINNAFESDNYKSVNVLDRLNLKISKHKKFINKDCDISEIRHTLITYLLNEKKQELIKIIDSSKFSLIINAMIYSKDINEFSLVKSKLLNLEFFNLN